MFYADHERTIYSPPGVETKYDPLALLRKLKVATAGKFDSLWSDWCAVNDTDSGDVSIPRSQTELVSAEAESELVAAARTAFGLPEFPECLDATALEYLRDFVEWLEGKGQRVTTSQ